MGDIHGEAAAFDAQIRTRIANGHVPDLRRATKCDWFFNNPWRHPEYARLDFGQIFERVDAGIRAHVKTGRPARVLEIGCGPGYLSLELARAGHDVTGIDVSGGAIEVARSFSESDPWISERGPLRFVHGDFLSQDVLSDGGFDAIVFCGALHHFPQQAEVGDRARQLLAPGGIVIVHEPTRDRYTVGLGVLIHMLRVILSAGGNYFEEVPVPADEAERMNQVDRIIMDLKFEADDGSKTQSPNDNEAGYEEMSEMLAPRFERLEEYDTYAFFHEMIGGLRYDEKTNVSLARFLRDSDALLVRHGVIPGTEFFYIGRRK